MPPTVSVCLPVFNGQQHLGEAIESVLVQSYEDLELIVVDDYSTDGSRWVMDQYARKDGRIKCYANQERRGLFANYNLCLQHSEGSIIKLFAQDDLLHPKNLEWCVDTFRSNPEVVLAASARNWIDENGTDVTQAYRTPSFDEVFTNLGPVPGREVVSKSLVPVVNYIGEPACVAFPRAHMSDGFDPGFHHLGDLDYWLRILLKGEFVYNPEILCSFRRHSKNETNKNLSELRVATDLLRIGRKFRAEIIDCGFTEREFMRSALQLISDHLFRLTRTSEQSNVHALLTSAGPCEYQAPEDSLYLQRARRLLSTLSTEELRDLTSYALEMFAEERNVVRSSNQPSATVKVNEALISRYEKKLSRLLADPCWKATTALRVAKRGLTAGRTTSQASVAPQHNSDQTSDSKPETRQEEYIQYLKAQITKIKRSRSYAIGRFLRRPDIKFGALAASVNRMLGRRTIHQQIRDLTRSANASLAEPAVSWQPIDSLITEVIYDFKSPRPTAQVNESGSNLFESGVEESKDYRKPVISVLLSIEREEPSIILAALAKQTLPSEAFEVIMVDATETPNLLPATREFMQGEGSKLPLRAFKCVHGGRAVASNVQLRLASSDLILFLAGDFVPPPEFLERHVEFHNQNTNETVGGIGGAAFPPELNDTHLRRWLDDSGRLFGVRLVDDSADLPPNYFYCGNASVKKSLVFQAGLFDEDFPYDAYEHYELGLRLRKLGVQFKYIPGTTCMHHHPITLKERLGTEGKAAESAVVIDRKYAGVKPWHKLLYTSPQMHALKAAGEGMRYCISGKSNYLNGFYSGLLRASFAQSYRKHLSKLHPANVSDPK